MLHLLLHRLSPTCKFTTPTKRCRFSKLHALRYVQVTNNINICMYIYIHYVCIYIHGPSQLATTSRVHIPEPSSSIYHRHRFIIMIILSHISLLFLSPLMYVAVAVMWVIRLYKAGKQHLDPLCVGSSMLLLTLLMYSLCIYCNIITTRNLLQICHIHEPKKNQQHHLYFYEKNNYHQKLKSIYIYEKYLGSPLLLTPS